MTGIKLLNSTKFEKSTILTNTLIENFTSDKRTAKKKRSIPK